MKKRLYISFGLSSESRVARECFRKLQEKDLEIVPMHFSKDGFGWREACPQMACDGIVVVHFCTQRVRYDLRYAPDLETRKAGVPVLFLGFVGVDHSCTCVGVRTGLYRFETFDSANFMLERIFAFCAEAGSPCKR